MAKGAGGGEFQLRRQQAEAIAGGQGGKVAKPEKQLNSFVRAVALIERVGNALGTLAFTWATVVLLGGYPTVLREEDFWFATAIVFLEAVRMFMSRNNRLDYKLFFQTKGAVRPLGWNGLIVIVYLCSTLIYTNGLGVIVLLIIPGLLGLFNSSGVLNLLSKPVRHAISICSPLVATILLVPFLIGFTHSPAWFEKKTIGFTQARHSRRVIVAMWVVFVLVFSIVLLITISRLHFQRVIRLVQHVLGTKHVLWRRLVLNICMFVELVMLVLIPDDPFLKAIMLPYSLYALVLVSFGNLQIPVAVIRVALSLMRLIPHDYNGDDHREDDAKTNLAPSLCILYVMVLGQGILYIAACLLEIFSFIPRRTLARRGGFRGQWGVQTVNLYYAYAFEKCMEKGALAPKKISLSSFAMDSINSYSPKKQVVGIQIIYNLIQRGLDWTELLSKFDASTKTLSRIIGMLSWTRSEYSVF